MSAGRSLARLTERREADRDDVQPVVEIVAEAPIAHQRLDRSRRRVAADDARPRGWVLGADARELLLLEDSQELRLDREVEVAHLVEEERRAVRLLEAADARATAPVNAPFSWPKNSLSMRSRGSRCSSRPRMDAAARRPAVDGARRAPCRCWSRRAGARSRPRPPPAPPSRTPRASPARSPRSPRTRPPARARRAAARGRGAAARARPRRSTRASSS